jgi:hypothetical protein
MIKTGGTGRISIWLTLLGKMASEPVSFIFGFGPGSVSFYNYGLFYIRDAHSFYMQVFYMYGGIGLIGLICLIAWLWRKQDFGSKEPLPRVKRAFFWMFCIGGLFDNYQFTAQLLWFSALVIAVIASGSGAARDVRDWRKPTAEMRFG